MGQQQRHLAAGLLVHRPRQRWLPRADQRLAQLQRRLAVQLPVLLDLPRLRPVTAAGAVPPPGGAAYLPLLPAARSISAHLPARPFKKGTLPMRQKLSFIIIIGVLLSLLLDITGAGAAPARADRGAWAPNTAYAVNDT